MTNFFGTFERNKMIKNMNRDNGNRPQFSAHSNSVVKSNSAKVSSKKPNSIRSPTSIPGSIPAFFKPDRAKKEEESIVIPKKRARNEDITKAYDSNEDSDNDDFKHPPKIVKAVPAFVKPEKQGKKINPFRKGVSVKKEGALFEINDTDDFKEDAPTITTFIKPKKKQEAKTAEEEEEEREKERLLNSLKRSQKNYEYDADKKRCPYCNETLDQMTDPIKAALEEIAEKDEKHRQIELKVLEKENSTSMFTSSKNMIRKREVPCSERDAFCKLHNIELVIKPEGEREGYPTEINFDDIPRRVRKFDKELKEVIGDEIDSDYRDIAEQAYKDQGSIKARSTYSVLNRFEQSLPGYYGAKGAAVILNELVKMYLNTGYLEKHLVSEQLPLEFLQQVLIPEVGYRLIREDLTRNNDGKPVPNANGKAKDIMLKSIGYGSAIFPDEDAKIEDNHIDKPMNFSFLNDDDEDDAFQSD